MRRSMLASLALGCGALLGLASFNANAIPIRPGIKVNLVPAAGSTNWTSPEIGDPHGTVNLTGWENDGGTWTSATMVSPSAPAPSLLREDDTPPPPPFGMGLGVGCNMAPSINTCAHDVIGTSPWQIIDINISRLTGWDSLTFYLDGTNYGNGVYGYLLGATCTVGGDCTASVLASTPLATCTSGRSSSARCSFNLSADALLGYSDVWVLSSTTNQSGRSNANIQLGGYFYLYPSSVPEPEALGMFGLGIVLIGLFAGLRRRRIG